MFSIKRTSKFSLPALALSALFLFSACSKDDDGGTPNPNPTNEESFVLSMAIQGSEGNFTYYTVPFADVMSGSLSAIGQGIEQPGYYDFKQMDQTIYSIGGLDDVNVVAISKNENGALTQTGNVSFDKSLSDIVRADAGTLVAVSMSSDSDIIDFYTIEENSVSVTNSTSRPASDLTDVDGASFSGMRIVGDHVFLSYYISNPDTFETNYTDEAQVAVYSYPGFEFQQIITDDRVGPLGGFNTKAGLINDENGDIYGISHSNPANGYSQSTNSSGILRINNGETSFDPNYFFDIQTVAGGTPAHITYLGNGKAFAEINVAPRETQASWSDGPLRSAIIDLENKTVDFITGIPEHNGSGRRLAALHTNNAVYLTIPENNGIFVYKIDTNTYTATKGAEVEANFLAGFFKL